MDATMNEPLANFLTRYQQRIETQLETLLDSMDAYQTPLVAAMRYSLLGGGKRMRPLLAYGAAQAVEEVNPTTDIFACALECIHVYSLIHDDLPAMDNDDLRRGKPTSHIAFDHATAILAGDALQCLAFETLSASGSSSTLAAVAELARASGARGMVLGQAIDLFHINAAPSIEVMEVMHRHKTGALIEASVVLGAMSANASEQQIHYLRDYAKAIGLAFQVTDDILDVTSDTQTLGKTQGADKQRNKPTYVSLLGLAGAQEKANSLCQQALTALASFDARARHLRELAHYIIERKH